MKELIKAAERRGRMQMEEMKNKEIAEKERWLDERERRKREYKRKIQYLATKFKGHVFRLIIPGLFFKGTIYQKAEERKKKLKEYEDTFPPIMDAIVTNMKTAMRRAAKPFWECEDCVHVIISSGKQALYGERVPPEREIEQRCDFILETLTSILEELLSARFKDRLSDYILSFVGFYFERGNHPQGEFHMDYEVDRMVFDSFGGLG